MGSLRLKGLVSRMQRVREQLIVGIPADQADAFRADICSTIARVEELCAAHRQTPRQLPLPSYQAFRYLKTLDLEHLPIRDLPPTPAVPTARIKHPFQLRQQVQAELHRLALAPLELDTPSALHSPDFTNLLFRLGNTTARVEELLCQKHSHVSRLGLYSRQVYQWARFLSTPEHLLLHLNALRYAYGVLGDIERQKRFAGGAFRLNLEFFAIQPEWSALRKGTVIHATFNEAFVGAGSRVIEALVRLAFQARRKSYLQIVRTHSAGPEFAESLQTIEFTTVDLDPNVRGRCYDLLGVFNRVNRTYFDGRLTPPRLTWNKSTTIHLMGHYQHATDTVTISMSLDHPQVPEWAIDHVMHHELLHRVLGIQVVDGRLYAHTPQFRAAERTFLDYARADAFLNEWSARLKRA